MVEHWESLIANLAVVALFISVWVHAQFLFAGRKRVWRDLGFGVLLGVGAVASMLLAIQVDGGLFDLRASLVALAAFFGGPLAAVVAVTIAGAYRVLVVGGQYGVLPLVGLCASALTGLAVSHVTRGRVPALVSAFLLAAMVPASSLAVSAGLRMLIGTQPQPLSLVVASMNFAATGVCAVIIMRNRRDRRLYDLMRAAFEQAPDFQYVKTPESRFAAVNEAVARLYGVQGINSPADMVGKTDFDLMDDDRAEALMLAERKVVESGVPLIDVLENIKEPNGDDRWYLTSKIPLRGTVGEVIGIAGVTRDVTAQRKLQQEVVNSRNQLDYVLESVDDGIAMFDLAGVLVYCNDQYSDMFPLTREVRKPGRTIKEILYAAARTGEERGVPNGKEDEWVETVAATLHTGSDQEINLKDGRWMHIRSRPMADGSALVVVTDISKMKQTESALVSLTEQLKALATTDALTGLVNRRGFDTALETEIARSRRNKEPMSLLLIDADRFKAYNDLYGHQAGDDVLKAVADCLKQALKRPGDVAARYGGEEFAAILPNTDEDGAFFIADAFREALKGCALPHKGAGNKGVVSVSVGIAVFDERDLGLSAAELLRRADEALYNAKGAGRDRIIGWRPRPAIRPVGGLRA